MNGYKIVLLKAIFMLYKLPEDERVCSGICTIYNKTFLMHEDGEDFISGIIGFEDLRLFPFITGKLVTFRYF